VVLQFLNIKSICIHNLEAAQLGIDSPEVVLGFVGQSSPANDWSGWIQFTPGVSVVSNNDSKGQQYCSPTQAVLQKGADVIIVGRSIINHPDTFVAAEQCRAEGWDAMMKRIET
jgi:orotidine-5'-phosphate decarboxylase